MVCKTRASKKAIASGHYVRVHHGPQGSQLLRGLDPAKDQSYFLWGLPREILPRLLFPVGELTKDEVRERARGLLLPTAEKPESQEICFVPEGNYAAVIEKLRPGAADPGEIVDMDGRVLGRHEGVIHYTIGQRRGLLRKERRIEGFDHVAGEEV